MKKLILIISAFIIISLIAPLIDNISSHAVINYNITYSGNITIEYYHHPGCLNCRNTAPVIEELINNGLKINKINVKEQYNLAIANKVYVTPTLIINDQRIVGEFTISQVIDLINNQ